MRGSRPVYQECDDIAKQLHHHTVERSEAVDLSFLDSQISAPVEMSYEDMMRL